jgi:hypothetical protein
MTLYSGLSLTQQRLPCQCLSPDLAICSFLYSFALPSTFGFMSDPALRIKTSSSAMPPITRSKARAMEAAATPEPADGGGTDSDFESDSAMTDYDTEESPSVVRSPTNLLYSLEKLPDETRASVADTFREPPLIALEHCRRINETYAFQMKELVTRSIRIRAPGSDGPRLSCSCRAQPSMGEKDIAEPCPHLLWLLDQLLKETLCDHDEERELTMMSNGYAEEMGDPFSAIADYHLDVLAPRLHCPLIDPETGYEASADPTRVLEARELLAPYHSMSPDDLRPDIFSRSDEELPSDLDRAVFNALIEDNHFFHQLLSQARSTDPIKDPFRKLSQRVDRVLRDLDLFVSSPSGDRWSLETPSDVAWAANHILGSVSTTRAIIFRRDSPLLQSAAISAASTLVHILEAVVARNIDMPGSGQSRRDRNLYLRLIGDRDQSFVIDVLEVIPVAASQFVHRLEAALERISIHGAPLSYVDKFRALLRRLRTTRFAPS